MPLEVKNVGIQFEGQVGHHQVLLKMSLATRGDVKLDNSLCKVLFWRSSITAGDGDSLGSRGVGEEPISGQLMYDFTSLVHLERAQPR